MNRILLLAVLFISSSCFAQKSLRDSLFSGKLKADSALVASSKIVKDTSKKIESDQLSKTVADTSVKQGNTEKTELKYSDNNKTWRKFTDEYTRIITTEMAATKKVKKGGYTVTLEYEIGTDGVVSTKNIICDPKSEALIDLINERMMANAPQLAPQIVNGAPRKSSKRQILVFVKEKN
jgi:predicted secreted protein